MKPYSAIAALLASAFLLIAGNGLVTVLTPLRAKIEGFPELTIGLLGSVYFGGMLAGTLATPFLVRRAGHIRAFSALVAAAVVTVILLPAILQPVAWLILRGALGFVFAGLYSVIESWINAKATNSNRGALYGFYQIVAYAASAGGQLALTLQSATTFVGFTMGGALIALSTIPLALTNADAPIQPRGARLRLGWLIRLSPVGALAAFLVGATNGAYSALGPVYALGVGFSPQAAPLFTAAVTIGSALGVYPAGRLSDFVDRRAMIAALSGVGACVEIALWRLQGGGSAFVALGFAVGLTTFTLYTLTTSHANDRARAEHTVLVSTGLLFLYSAGAIVAPVLAAALMRLFGPGALYAQNALLHLALAAFALWRYVTFAPGLRPINRAEASADAQPAASESEASLSP
ncbi:MAG TPA: MFS transporter [Roseiarcus sp.]|nr:MFS transporter [Roseiarcus sp.]